LETHDTNVNNNWVMKRKRKNISTSATENLYNELIQAWFQNRFSKLSHQKPWELFNKFNCKQIPILMTVFHYTRSVNKVIRLPAYRTSWQYCGLALHM